MNCCKTVIIIIANVFQHSNFKHARNNRNKIKILFRRVYLYRVELSIFIEENR